MPTFFKNKAEMLHTEALASLIILEDRYFKSSSIKESEKLCYLVNNARNRVLRRWEFAFGGK